MKTIELKKDILCGSEKEIEELNTESNIYIYNKRIIKIFKKIYMLDIKEKIIDFLDENRIVLNENLEEILLPLFKVNIDKKFSGYGMKFLTGESLEKYLAREDISFENKKLVLIKIGEFLEKMKLLREKDSKFANLFVNDMHPGNIMVENGNIKFLDVDSFSVSSDYSCPSYYLSLLTYSPMFHLEKYRKDVRKILPNEESDMYCYIMIVEEFLTGLNLRGKSYSSYLYYLKKFKELGMKSELIDSF